jgi:hypothetical protein
MPILQGDIRLVASQVMSDATEGGGAPTNTLIVDGQSNGVFPDVSETDRAGGRVNLRKVFVQVNTDTRDTYLGANVILEDPPDDPRVSVTLFSTGATFDRRDAATNRMESYLSLGPAFPALLFGDHIAGQMTVSLIGQINIVLPVVGTTMVLRKLSGQANQADQYVRVTDVSSRVRTFEDNIGVFTRLEVTLSISDPLNADFPGYEVKRYDFDQPPFSQRTRVFDSIVADAARYYGVSPLANPADLGDYTVQANSIYTQLVPSAQVETPIADARLNQQLALPVEAGEPLTRTVTLAFTTSQAMYIGGGITPASLSVVRAGITLKDKGGVLVNDATTDQVGTVDYGNGVLSLSTNVFGTSGGGHQVTYTPADSPELVTSSFAIPVTQAGQRLTYVATVQPIPVRGSTQVSFRAGGRWYVLTDDGSGAIRGSDGGFGVGTVNFSTGTLSLTLGALPDVGSMVIVNYAPSVVAPKLNSQGQTGSPLNDRAFFAFDLGQAVKPGTVSISWNDGASRIATDNSLGGFTGYGVGEVFYATGLIRLAPTTLPAVGTVLTIAVTETVAHASVASSFSDGGGTWGFTLPSVSKAGSVELAVLAQRPVRQYPGIDVVEPMFLRVFDDASGNLKVAAPGGNLTVGTVTYASGVCALNKSITGWSEDQGVWLDTRPYDGGDDSRDYTTYRGTETRSLTLQVLNGSGSPPTNPPWAWWATFTGAADARFAGADGTGSSLPVAIDALYVRAGRSQLYLASDLYQRSGQQFILNPLPTTGEGVDAGTVTSGYNPLVGEATFSDGVMGGRAYVTLTAWSAGFSPQLLDAAGIVVPYLGNGTVLLTDAAVFRTAVSPLRNGSLQVLGEWADGTTVSATSDTSGYIISGSAAIDDDHPGTYGVFGTVDYASGVVELRFGRRVASGVGTGVVDLSNMAIPGVTWVQSQGVVAGSLRYNAAAYTYIPLDANIIGVNPVRLPSDGRVPIFRSGSYAVVGHTASVTATVSNAQVIDCARVRLSRVRVIGSDGVVINTGYTADLDAGLVTFTDVSGYPQPVTIEHRIEDMALVSDAQINGQLTFTRPLTHDYPLGSTVSSALVAGDLYARVPLLFDQASWTNVWSDILIGSQAPGTYNDIDYPLVMQNAGALTERWAIVFSNTTSFTVQGEHVGVIANGNTVTDCAPINQATGEPYFSIPAAGWGSGWAVGNVLRFNTVGAEYPVWVVRTVQQGPETVGADQFTLLVRGDVDRP